MTTFFLLPPRALVANRLTDVLGEWLPGLERAGAAASELADTLADWAERHGDGCVIFRDELPEGEAVSLGEVLADGFGAEPGDRIVEVRGGSVLKVWVLPSPNGIRSATMTAEDEFIRARSARPLSA